MRSHNNPLRALCAGVVLSHSGDGGRQVHPTPLSVCIITYNEAENLPRCLASVAFADEIVVVDSQSTDRTVDIARQAGCRVISQAFLGYVAQKNLALRHASHQWVLCLDADEWLRPGAGTTIQAALAKRPPDVAGYTLKRHTYYLGDWVNHSGWWPEYKIRLFDRQRGQWCGDALHEGIRVEGRVDHLDVEIGHRSYKDIAHHVSKLNTYTTVMARHLHERGAVRVGVGTLVLHPVARFCRMFLLKGGWQEGVRGLLIATIGAFYVFAKYAKLWELQHGSQPPPAEGGTLNCAPSADADAGNGPCGPSADAVAEE
jgi:glycosyltransferase involved in cell wall biosynthesis